MGAPCGPGAGFRVTPRPALAAPRFCPGARPLDGMAVLSGLTRDTVKEDAIEAGVPVPHSAAGMPHRDHGSAVTACQRAPRPQVSGASLLL
jgi:hypothetical protein